MPARHIADLAGTRRNQFRIRPADLAGAPTTGTHLIGELHMDSVGELWHCLASGTPGTWERLSGLVEGQQENLAVGTTVLDAVDVTRYKTIKWALELTKGSNTQVFEILASHDNTTPSEMRPVSMQLGTGTFDVTAAIDTSEDLLRLTVTPLSTGWTATWRQLYRFVRLSYRYLRPDGINSYLRPNGASPYLRP